MRLRRDTQREPRTLLEQIDSRTGSLRLAVQVGQTIASWAIVHTELGRTPFVHEYADYWKVSERTAWREIARFKEAFPEEENPDRIVVQLLAQTHEATTAAVALSMPPVDLAV